MAGTLTASPRRKTKTRTATTDARRGPCVLAAIGLGANLASPRRRFRVAIDVFGRAGSALEVAPLYRTEPVLGRDAQPQPAYLNTVLLLHTSLPPDALLAIGKRLEMWAGRTPAKRWAPRTLDVDLLVWGDRQEHNPEIELPHPRLGERRFVLQPLCDVAPDLRPPGSESTVAELLERSGDSRVVERVPWDS